MIFQKWEINFRFPKKQAPRLKFAAFVIIFNSLNNPSYHITSPIDPNYTRDIQILSKVVLLDLFYSILQAKFRVIYCTNFHVTCCISGHITDRKPGRMTGYILDHLLGHILSHTYRIPCHITDRIRGYIPGHIQIILHYSTSVNKRT